MQNENRSPYKAMFSCDAKIGLSTSSLPHGLLCSLESKEDLVEHLNRAEEEGNDLRAPGHLDQPDTQDDGLEIEICLKITASKLRGSPFPRSTIGMGIKIFFSTSTSVKILSDRFLILLACLLSDSEAFRLSSKGDPRNLLAVILSREEHGYKLGTKSGVLRGLYTRNQFELSDNNFLKKVVNSINCLKVF
jgi:hypothetical protein